jgi:predicted transcriptional regulator
MTNCSQLSDHHIKIVEIHDLVSNAIEVMEQFDLHHLPILDGKQFAGLISSDDLLEADPSEELLSLERYFLKASVRTGDHVSLALRVRSKFSIDFVPVINEKNEWEGSISADKMLDEISRMMGVSENSSLLVLEINRIDYALGEINRLVESNDAMIMQVNTLQDPLSDIMQVVLRINKEDISDIVATFQRHEYTVIYYYGEESYSNELQSNLSHLLNYLNI